MFTTIKRIVDWCGDFKGKIYLGFVMSVFSYWFAAAPVAIAAYSISKLFFQYQDTSTFDTSLIWLSMAGIALAVFLQFLFDYLRARYQESISFELVARDRLAIGEAMKRVSLGYFQKVNTGNILSSITTGLTALEGMGIRMLNTFIGGYLNYLAILSVLIVFSPLDAAIALVAAAASFGCLLLVSKHSQKNATILTKSNHDLTSATLEYARGLSVVKSFGQDGVAAESIKDAITASKNTSLRIEMGFLSPNCLHLIALKCGSVGIASATCLGMYNGNLDFMIGLMLTLFSFTIFASLEPISESAHVLGVINDAMDQVDNLKSNNFIDRDGQAIDLDHYDIVFDDVDFGYDDRQVLKDVTFTIPEHTSTAIVGPSGSGKTTIVNLIARFYDVNNGSISVGGHNVREFTCDSLLSNISMVFQNVYLFNDTIRTNICFGKPDCTEAEMIEAAQKARCHDFIMELPDGYDTIVGEGGGRLSGGEKQRISIARAILKDAPIVILDEATASIDPENEHLIQHALTELTQGKTVITIAHRLATIEQADQILVIDDGRLSQKGTHAELINQPGIYRRFMEARQKAEGWNIAS